MPKFRKRPVIIEAYQWHEVGPYRGEPRVVDYYRHPDMSGLIQCPHCDRIMHDHGYMDKGGHVVCPCDWIIKGIKGEMYPCRPDIFAATYEPVTEE